MTESVTDNLRRYWGYETFLPLQKEAMDSVLAGRDSIVVLPTGGGKSLCYQAPAVTMPGLALVISPLISLMKDQVDALGEWGVSAARLDSSMNAEERAETFRKLRTGELKLLYLSPERVFTDGFQDLVGENRVSFIAVDEAHCVSMWGHDFRPEYRKLGKLKEFFPGIGLHAYTATATEHVRSDIAEQLHLQVPEILVGSFDRPNLIYRVERRKNRLNQVLNVLGRHRGESGIIYCISRKNVDSLTEKLREMGYKTVPYHAGLNDSDRKKNQEAFIQEKADIVVATVAFGMGIDKSNVRFVIHSGMPKSLEHYQQESGRAGRDGLEAECVLLFSGGDHKIWQTILGDMEPEPRQIAFSKLSDMFDFCARYECRHKAIVAYFGQELGKDNCRACDVCLGHHESVPDALTIAQKILSCVVRLGERFGGDYTARVLTASSDPRIEQYRHDRLSTYGILREYRKHVVREWIEQLASQDALGKTGEYNVLGVTEKGWRIIRGQEVPRLATSVNRRIRDSRVSNESKRSWTGVDRELFEKLRALRTRIADRKQVPPYVVFGDRSLRDMARRLPTNTDEFMEVDGVGGVKCRQYGSDFIRVIREHREGVRKAAATTQGNLLEEVTSSREKPEEPLSEAVQRASQYFRMGLTIEEVGEILHLDSHLARKYLLDFIQREKITDPEPWVSREHHRRVVELARENGPHNLDRIRKGIPDLSVEDLHVSLACLGNE